MNTTKQGAGAMAGAKEKIEATAAELGLTMTAEFVPWSKSRNAGEKDPSLNWKVTLLKDGRPCLETDYMAGMGHAPSYTQGRMTAEAADLVNWECERGVAGRIDRRTRTIVGGKPILPDLADVLSSLASDADAIDHATFEDWASDLGYDTDSREAEKTYRACLEIGLKLRSALGDDGLAKLREAVAEY